MKKIKLKEVKWNEVPRYARAEFLRTSPKNYDDTKIVYNCQAIHNGSKSIYIRCEDGLIFQIRKPVRVMTFEQAKELQELKALEAKKDFSNYANKRAIYHQRYEKYIHAFLHSYIVAPHHKPKARIVA